MNPILHQIIATKKKEIQATDPARFPKRIPPILSLKKALKHPSKITVLAECKKGSPSAGILRKDYNALSISKIYYESGASAISVLTDVEYFQGSLEDLFQVSQSIPLPILRKDFIIDKLQIQEAYSFGASAILLIARILEEQQLRELKQYAESLGLEILIETHNKIELQLALDLDFEIIGINTRDLDTFQIHPELIESLASLIPKEKVCVGESGIIGNADYLKYKGKVDSLLIGTYFMKSKDVSKAFQELLAGG